MPVFLDKSTLCAAGGLVLLALTAAQADTITWTGDSKRNPDSWLDPDNWDVDAVPMPGDDVVIPDVPPTTAVVYSLAKPPLDLNSLSCDEPLIVSDGSLVLDTVSEVSNALTLNGGAIGGAGQLTVEGLLSWSSGSMFGTGATQANGGLSLFGPGNKTLGSSRILNNAGSGTWEGGGNINGQSTALFNNELGATFAVLNDSSWIAVPFTNAGTFTKTTALGTTTFLCPFTNSGTVEAASGTLSYGPYEQAAGATILSGGTITTVQNIILTSGSLSGTGTLSGGVINVAAEINPGDPFGTVVIAGNFAQNAAGTLNIEIGEMDQDEFIVSGAAALDGTLNITLIDMFQPALFDSFDVLNAVLRLEHFCDLSAPALPGGLFFDLTYDLDRVTLEVVGADPDLDCNSNGVLDACDLEDCMDLAACDDCNLNEVLDECDIAAGTSDDDNMDGVPDECTEPMIGGNWTDDMWGLPGGSYPDNVNGVPGLHVTLFGGGTSVFLDDTVEIETLRLLDGATLEITQAGVGDLNLVDAGGIVIRGNVLVDEDRVIDAAGGAVNIRAGGTYKADPAAVGPVSTSLTADVIRIEGGPPGSPHGAMILTDSMVVSCGDLLVDGTVSSAGSAGANLGDGSPPDFRALDTTGVDVDGNAVVIMDGDDTALGGEGVVYRSSEPMTLAGNFANLSTNPFLFDWLDGSLEMNGSTLQSIQAAGEDRGPSPIGLINNYAFGTLILSSGTIVTVFDDFDNQLDGQTACDEALYVEQLIVQAGAVLNADGCKVYYKELMNAGSIPGMGTDVLEICDADVNGDDNVNVNDLLILLASWGPCQNCPSDIDGDDGVAVTDLLILLAAWGSC